MHTAAPGGSNSKHAEELFQLKRDKEKERKRFYSRTKNGTHQSVII